MLANYTGYGMPSLPMACGGTSTSRAWLTLVGHVDTRCIESNYCHINEDYAFLQALAAQALGQANPTSPAAPQPPVAPGDTPSPGPDTAPPAAAASHAGDLTQGVLRLLVRQIEELKAQLAAAQSAQPAPASAPTVTPARRVAYDAARWAMSQNPALVTATDRQLYEWLATHPSEYQHQLPPLFLSFKRYLCQARRVIDQCGKRQQQRKQANDSNPSPKK